MGLANLGKIVVFSDTHFGTAYDPTETEETNERDLYFLLDLIVDEIKPQKIVMLGDIFDLWRVPFEDAWNNTLVVNFFGRLSNYIEASKDPDAELIYVLGNHDHVLQEMNFGVNSLKRYRDIIAGNNPKKIFGELFNEIKNINLDPLNVKVYYPYYKLKTDEMGTIFFDHGHYLEKSERLMKKILDIVYKIAPFTKKGKNEKKADAEKIFKEMELTLSSLYAMIYYTKFDETVRAGRDFIWRIASMRGKIVAIIIGFGLTGLISYFLNISTLEFVGGGSVLTLFLYSLPKIFGAFISTIVTNNLSSNKGMSVDKIVPKITKENISTERKDYTYKNLIQELKNDDDEIKHYIFAHTHIAGMVKDKNGLNIYNCGGWVKAKNRKTSSCINSFIIIDPKSSEEEKIKIYRIEKRKKIECKFDEKGKCRDKKACMFRGGVF